MTRSGLILLALLAVALVERPAVVSASVLCRVKSKALVIRDVCKPREETITPAGQVELGMGGKVGPGGPPGPAVGSLRVLDADGDQVGIVTRTSGYYGTATVVGNRTLPTGSGPEFVIADVDARGLAGYSSCADVARLYRTPDCQGEALADCNNDSFACSSVEGAFFARPLFRNDETTMCYVGDPSEIERGAFHRRFRTFGLTPGELVFRCQQVQGTIVTVPFECRPGSGLLCADCCQGARPAGAIPVHIVDASLVGTPPFRLSR